MILRTVLSVESPDTSGETVDVKGADLSSFDTEDGILINYEHINKDSDKDDGKPYGSELVGKLIHYKKIFTARDCDDAWDREMFERTNKVPILVGALRLFDGAGHASAKELAAIIRDCAANNEPIPLRWSVEGTTVEREGNRLASTIIKRIALTHKPANKGVKSTLVSDPNAPPGFEIDNGSKEMDDLLAQLADAKKFELPIHSRLGAPVTVEYQSPDQVAAWLIKERIRSHLKKTMTAGTMGGAPSTLTGGAALQREDISLRAEKLKKLKSSALAAYRDFDKSLGFSKGEFRTFLKHKLPEADESFIDHFTDLIGDHHVKLKKAIDLEGDRVAQQHEGLTFNPIKEGPKPKEPKPAKGKKGKAAPPPTPKIEIVSASKPLHEALHGSNKNSASMDENGTLTIPTQGAVLPFHDPTGISEYSEITNPGSHPDRQVLVKYKDSDGNKHEEMRSAHQLYHETVHKPWERAMRQWIHINQALREGRLPRSMVKLGGLFAAMSPNTGVALQERHFGHVMDMLHEGAMKLGEPITEKHIKEFSRRAQGWQLPNWNRDHYEEAGPAPGVMDDAEAEKRANKQNKFGNKKSDLPQVPPMRHLDRWMDNLEHLVATHKGDGAAISRQLMNDKGEYEGYVTDRAKWNKAKEEHAKQGLAFEQPEPQPPKSASVYWFGPKLLRYALGMMGHGNIIVPDRHMTRSLFNLGMDHPMSEHLAKNFVTNSGNERFLQALDKHFFEKHPAVKHVLNHPEFGEYFRQHPEQAIFPAFWLHWLHIPHYERNQGRETEATIGGTDHGVFWNAAKPILNRHGIPISHENDYDHDGQDTSFDFSKSEGRHPMAHLPMEARALGAMNEMRQKIGDVPAMFMFYHSIAPALRSAELSPQQEATIRKMENLTIMIDTLRKAVRLRKASADSAEQAKRHAAQQAFDDANAAPGDSWPPPPKVAPGHIARGKAAVSSSSPAEPPGPCPNYEDGCQCSQCMRFQGSAAGPVQHLPAGAKLPDDVSDDDAYKPGMVAAADPKPVPEPDELENALNSIPRKPASEPQGTGARALKQLDKLKAGPKPIRFAGKDVYPGEIKIQKRNPSDPWAENWEKRAIIGEHKGMWITAPKGKEQDPDHEDLLLVPKAEQDQYKLRTTVTKPLSYDSKGAGGAKVLDSTIDTVPNFTLFPAQHALVHGMVWGQNKYDEDKLESARPGHFDSGVTDGHWAWNAQGKRVYMKPDMPDDFDANGFPHQRREVAYHNLAHNFFGMGHYLPNTALVKDPKDGSDWVAVEGLPNVRHFRDYNHSGILNNLSDSGELDKMGIMNMVMGNRDRHGGNYLINEQEGKLHLIDHGLAFQTPHRQPDYWYQHGMSQSIHPEAKKWAMALKPKELRAQLVAHGVPKRFADPTVQRLEAIQTALKYHNPDRHDIYDVANDPDDHNMVAKPVKKFWHNDYDRLFHGARPKKLEQIKKIAKEQGVDMKQRGDKQDDLVRQVMTLQHNAFADLVPAPKDFAQNIHPLYQRAAEKLKDNSNAKRKLTDGELNNAMWRMGADLSERNPEIDRGFGKMLPNDHLEKDWRGYPTDKWDTNGRQPYNLEDHLNYLDQPENQKFWHDDYNKVVGGLSPEDKKDFFNVFSGKAWGRIREVDKFLKDKLIAQKAKAAQDQGFKPDNGESAAREWAQKVANKGQWWHPDYDNIMGQLRQENQNNVWHHAFNEGVPRADLDKRNPNVESGILQKLKWQLEDDGYPMNEIDARAENLFNAHVKPKTPAPKPAEPAGLSEKFNPNGGK